MKPINRLIMGIMLCVVFTATQAMAEVKIGTFDVQKFQQKSQVIKKKKDLQEKRLLPAKQKLEQENEALKKLENDFQKKRSVLAVDAINDMVFQIEAKRRLVKYLYEDYKESLKADDIELSKIVEKDLEEIIKGLAKKETFTIIFDKRTMGLLWSDGAVDITDKVIETYDKTIKP